MKLLLDTHVILWALTDDPRLTPAAREMLLAPDHVLCFSAVSLWEIALKNQKSPERCPYPERDILDSCLAAGYEPLQVTPAHILAIRGLQLREGRTLSNLDPFDRLLIAQAKAEGARILSHDSNFENYQEPCIALI